MKQEGKGRKARNWQNSCEMEERNERLNDIKI